MTLAVYFIGGPGVGKSTWVASALEGWTPGPYVRFTSKEMFGHILHDQEGRTGAYLGHLRPEYPGTDALSMSVAPQALLWAESLPLLGLDLVIGEGARLAHMGFLQALDSLTNLSVVYLYCDPAIAAERRRERGGKQLADSFCKTQFTRAANLARACHDNEINLIEIDTEKVPCSGVALLKELGYSEPRQSTTTKESKHG